VPALPNELLHDCPAGHAAAQVPFEQHPPLHGEIVSHEVVHVKSWHASPVGQSPDVPQVQAPAPHVPELQQKLAPHSPSVLPPHVLVHVPAAHVGVPSLHAWHRPPTAPHVPLAVPGWHSMPSQHPPLHVRPAAQTLEQTWKALHAMPVGQSATESLQPVDASAPVAPSCADASSCAPPPSAPSRASVAPSAENDASVPGADASSVAPTPPSSAAPRPDVSSPHAATHAISTGTATKRLTRTPLE
jgi:hypothetical protein